MVSGLKYLSANPIAKKLKFAPLAIVGMFAFALNSNLAMHPYLQVYIVLLEAKLGILVIYLLAKQFTKSTK
ncbi:hypothetical protein HCU40_11300 [Pseudanabaena biceps]|nr:hypothetical protein [Pseudanabaena biceps]